MSQTVTRTFSLTLELPLVCTHCGDPCGFLFPNADGGPGRCLSCELDREAIDRYEANEADEEWGRLEMSCSTCGID